MEIKTEKYVDLGPIEKSVNQLLVDALASGRRTINLLDLAIRLFGPGNGILESKRRTMFIEAFTARPRETGRLRARVIESVEQVTGIRLMFHGGVKNPQFYVPTEEDRFLHATKQTRTALGRAQKNGPGVVSAELLVRIDSEARRLGMKTAEERLQEKNERAQRRYLKAQERCLKAQDQLQMFLDSNPQGEVM